MREQRDAIDILQQDMKLATFAPFHTFTPRCQSAHYLETMASDEMELKKQKYFMRQFHRSSKTKGSL